MRDAIVKVLRARGDGATVAEIQEGVRAILGTDIRPSSVRSYLQIGSGEPNPLFTKIGRGRYRLRSR